MSDAFTLDGQPVPFTPGQTLMQAAREAGHYIPHLCWHPDFTAHGSCKLCTVKVNGRFSTACTTAASAGQVVENRSPELDEKRRTLLQLLFVEGNHFCPSCEKSGDCVLQATAYEMGMLSPHFDHFFPDRPVDASHPDVLLDFNRCILCELCVRASKEVDGKSVFALAGRGTQSHLIVNSPSGQLADTDFALTDRAAQVCPVGVILKKRVGFAVPIGERTYDRAPIRVVQVPARAKPEESA
ncbi:MAG: 2Fe-2S iron-sulfur cluster binding domain-containing protein [Limnohabitans sp.]|jgi:[NiFe] hydrogenase diaphorase moiety small subunit|nr:2Fe-2S iron-sulfur cluster binding domain-containing protein [Limnohabitans sp.]